MATATEPELRSHRRLRGSRSQHLVDELFERINSVSSLPAAVMHILAVTADPQSEAADLLEAVEGDPAIAARILRIVNSSFYPLQRSVGDLKTAITLLGFMEIRNLALTACVSNLFGSGGRHGGYSRQGLWRHSTGVGAAARLIARNRGRPSAGEAYLAGLLHDLGLILIDQHLHGPFCKLLDHLGPDTPTCAAELTVLGFDHTELGSHIARRWQFPDEVTDAIRFHHEPEQYEGPHHDMVCVVTMADFICTLHGHTALGVRNIPEPPNVVIDRLAFRPDDIRMFQQQLEQTLAGANVMASAGVD